VASPERNQDLNQKFNEALPIFSELKLHHARQRGGNIACQTSASIPMARLPIF